MDQQTDFYDMTTAQRFLDALEPGGQFTFQTFADPESLKDSPGYVRVLHGTLEQRAAELTELSKRGAGIFVTVCQTDGAGRKKENITAPRALCIDADGIPQPSSWPEQPNIIVVRDSLHWHAYWLLQPGQPLDQFTAAQKQLVAYFNSDPKVHDLPRVMRLVGYPHQKGVPVALTLARCEAEPRFTIADILAAHPVAAPVVERPPVTADQPVLTAGLSRIGQAVMQDTIERARAYVALCPQSIQGQDGSGKLMWAARALVVGFSMPIEVARSIIVNDFNPRCRPPWSAAEIEHKLNDAATKPFDKPRGWLLTAPPKPAVTSAPSYATNGPVVTSDTCTLAELLSAPEVLNPPPRIKTTYDALDQALGGGMVVGGTYVLAGPTSRFKSTLASNLTRRMAKARTKVLLISLEDDRYMTGRRMIAQESRVAEKVLEDYTKPGAITAQEQASVAQAKVTLQGIPVIVNSTTTGLEYIEELVEQEVRNGVQAVILDQSSWIEVEGAENVFQEASTISKRLALLARRVGVVLVVAVQINRAGAAAWAEGKRIELYHLRDSGRWEQDATGVIIVQSVDLATDPGTILLEVAKHRRGPRELSCTLNVTPRCALIDDNPAHPQPVHSATATSKGKKGGKAAPVWTAGRFVDEVMLPVPETKQKILYQAEMYGLSDYQAGKLLKKAEAAGLVWRQPGGPNGAPLFGRVSRPTSPPVVK